MWAGLDRAAPIGARHERRPFRHLDRPALRELLAEAGVELDAPPGEQRWDRARNLDRDALAEVLAAQKRALVERVVPAAGLTPDALTIGFARRFATYKRAGLIFSDRERLRRLLHDADRPVQLVVAGKAHPADAAGKELIRRVIEYARADGVSSRVAFLPDYDMALAKVIVPRRRHLAEHAAPAAGGERHERHEGRAQRRRQRVHARRLVGRGLRAGDRLGDRRRRARRGGRPGRRRRGGAVPDPRAGGRALLRGSARLARPRGRVDRRRWGSASAPTAWCGSTPRAITCPHTARGDAAPRRGAVQLRALHRAVPGLRPRPRQRLARGRALPRRRRARGAHRRGARGRRRRAARR